VNASIFTRFTLILATTAAILAPAGCGSGDSSTPSEATAADASSTPEGSVSSSIREGSELTDPVRWRAQLSGVSTADVSEVRFMVDGQVEHVEGLEPYQFAGDHNLLLPGTLGPGSHTFAVDVRLLDGRRLTAASTANVSRHADPVPAAVVGRWTRTVTPAEVARTEEFRNPEYGEPLPVGRWTAKIGADGVARYTDPRRRSDSLTVGQVRFEPGGRLIVGGEVPNFPGAEGSFCPDTVPTGDYRWSVEDGALVVEVIDDRECADRNSFWNGKFRRTEER
jgi:hypothetical protein